MDLTLGNSSGLWALAGVPAVLLIHLIQQRRLRVTTSTLFLIEGLAPLSSEGRRIDWLRFSRSLMAQLLCVVLLSAFLCDPHVARRSARQKVVIVLDDSYSMSAFKDARMREVRAAAARLVRSAASVEWALMRSSIPGELLYSGTDTAKMLNLVEASPAEQPGHDPAEALNFALSFTKGKGRVLLVSDHTQDLPLGAELLAVGAPLENWGFSGLRAAADGSCTFLIKNFGSQAGVRRWWIEAGGKQGKPESITLKAGEMRVLRSRLPAGETQAIVRLEGDSFTPDDVLPIVRPQPKKLAVEIERGGSLGAFGARVVRSLPALDAAPAERAAVLIASSDGSDLDRFSKHAVLFLKDAANVRAIKVAPIIVERHWLVDGLSFQGLLAKPGPLAPAPQDEPLLWLGDSVLAFVRTRRDFSNREIRTLVFNFSLGASNAERMPEIIVLLSRFFDALRAQENGFFRDNFESAQNVPLGRLSADAAPSLEVHDAISGGRETIALSPTAARLLRAPLHPGFFSVRSGSEIICEASSFFADVRESDFRNAERSYSLDEKKEAQLSELRVESGLRPLWALLLLAALLLSFKAAPIAARGGA